MTAHLPRDFPFETEEPQLLEALKEVPGLEGVLLQQQVGCQAQPPKRRPPKGMLFDEIPR